MRIDAEAVLGPVVLGLVLLAPVGAGVCLHHFVSDLRSEPAFLLWAVATVVLWIYGMIEARTKHGWSEVAVVALALPFMCVGALLTPGMGTQMVHEGPDKPIWPFGFLPLLAALSLLSAHWYGRWVHTALAMSLVATTVLSGVWYGEELYPILRRYFMWS